MNYLSPLFHKHSTFNWFLRLGMKERYLVS